MLNGKGIRTADTRIVVRRFKVRIACVNRMRVEFLKEQQARASGRIEIGTS